MCKQNHKIKGMKKDGEGGKEYLETQEKEQKKKKEKKNEGDLN